MPTPAREEVDGRRDLRGRVRAAWFRLLSRSMHRITLRTARGRSGPFAIVRHMGRRSGQARETPPTGRPIGDDLVVTLTYGPEVQWFRTVLAAGRCEILLHGTRYRVVAVEPLPADEALPALPVAERVVLRLLPRSDFRRFVRG